MKKLLDSEESYMAQWWNLMTRSVMPGVAIAALLLAGLGLGAIPTAAAQEVTCSLTATESSSFRGQCRFGSDVRDIILGRPEASTDAIWSGSISEGTRERSIEIAAYQYSAGPQLIVRTGAWHVLSGFVFSGRDLHLKWDEGVQAPPSTTDLSILRAARKLLTDENLWDRQDDRNCDNDESLISLYCALASATADAMGTYQHRQPAMQVVRRIIKSEWRERVVSHRLMDFNNDPRTTLADLARLFDLAEESFLREVR